MVSPTYSILASVITAGASRKKHKKTKVQLLNGGDKSEDNNIVKSLKGLTLTPNDCVNRNRAGLPCAPEEVINIIKEVLPMQEDSGDSGFNIIKAAQEKYKCPNESCVIEEVSRQVNANKRKTLERVLSRNFKPKGPRDSLALLNNHHIDNTLKLWGQEFTDFYPCPFAMMDFNVNGNEFNKVNFPDLLEGNVAVDLGKMVPKNTRVCKTFGCVVNTDTSDGGGKHWVAVFVDCRLPTGSPWSIEYFNSAGHTPPNIMIDWMESRRAILNKYRNSKNQLNNEVITVSVTNIDHQESQTECGLYALFYIRRRLEGVPYDFFNKQLVPDAAMTEFRKYIFR
jgi:hypothetical protein